MEKKKMKIKEIHQSLNSGLFDIFLQEEEGKRMLNIMIGEHEAKRISILIDQIEPPRPLTHDLIYKILTYNKIEIIEVIITKFIDGVYYANIISSSNGKEKIFDARTSDAINMALKFKSPIFASEEILNDVGFVADENDESSHENEIKIIIETSTNTQIVGLEKLLEIAVEQEDYDSAANLRDEIEKLKKDLKKKK